MFGDDNLRLRLTKSAGTETLVAQEFEVLVRARLGVVERAFAGISPGEL